MAQGQQRARAPSKEIICQGPANCRHEGMWCYDYQRFLESVQKSRFDVNFLNLAIMSSWVFFLLNNVWATYNITLGRTWLWRSQLGVQNKGNKVTLTECHRTGDAGQFSQM